MLGDEEAESCVVRVAWADLEGRFVRETVMVDVHVFVTVCLIKVNV